MKLELKFNDRQSIIDFVTYFSETVSAALLHQLMERNLIPEEPLPEIRPPG